MRRARCCCVTTTYLWRVWVSGCNTYLGATFNPSPSGGVPGSVCEVFADSGRTILVASGVTDSVGRVDVSLPGPALYYTRVSHPNGRFAVVTGSINLTSTTTVSTALAPAASATARCTPLCRIPILDTLNFSCTFGSGVMTALAGSRWEATVMVDAPACGGPVPVVIAFRATDAGFGGKKLNLSAVCPNDVGPTNWTGIYVAPTPTWPCPPAGFAISGSIDFNPFAVGYAGDAAVVQRIYNFAAPPYNFWYTITE